MSHGTHARSRKASASTATEPSSEIAARPGQPMPRPLPFASSCDLANTPVASAHKNSSPVSRIPVAAVRIRPLRLARIRGISLPNADIENDQGEKRSANGKGHSAAGCTSGMCPAPLSSASIQGYVRTVPSLSGRAGDRDRSQNPGIDHVCPRYPLRNHPFVLSHMNHSPFPDEKWVARQFSHKTRKILSINSIS